MFVVRWVSYSRNNQKMMSFRGQASWTKMTSPGGKLTALAYHQTKKCGGKLTALTYHQTKKVNKAEELTYLSTNIG
jgi:hypothetical protein